MVTFDSKKPNIMVGNFLTLKFEKPFYKVQKAIAHVHLLFTVYDLKLLKKGH